MDLGMVRRVTPLVLVAALAGCAGRGTPDPNPFSRDLADRAEVQIRVTNLNFNDATIWAIASESRQLRLGTVTGKRDAVFTVPWATAEPVYLRIDLVGGERCQTETLSVDPGDILDLQISIDPSKNEMCQGGLGGDWDNLPRTGTGLSP